jgi:hypothetical protein
MDEGAVGDKSEFWARACSKFLDNDYVIPALPIVDYPKVSIQLLADIAGVPYGDKKKFQRSQLEMQVKRKTWTQMMTMTQMTLIMTVSKSYVSHKIK